jgi:site-specific DNA-cytosine methylase
MLKKEKLLFNIADHPTPKFSHRGVSFTLNSRDYKAPAAICVGNGQLNQISMGEQMNTLNTMHDQQAVMENQIVRRITPLECERLQGFPDGWTDIGEWTDTKGKVHKESSDSARYKALGNSIATPFWQYLARRICAQYERDITIGSLFDGIGGFPYVFEKCGAKAVWASEIEEFPTAVTKKHFPEGTEQKWIKE